MRNKESSNASKGDGRELEERKAGGQENRMCIPLRFQLYLLNFTYGRPKTTTRMTQ